MEAFRSRSMKALTVSLVAAFALVLTIIVIAFRGAAKKTPPDTEETISAEDETTVQSPADILYTESEPETTAETTKEETTEAATTAPVYSLSFVSNGDGTCYVGGLGTYRSGEVDIPTLAPNGDLVTGIADYAFYNRTSIIRISIPSTLRSIGEYAFLGCSSLLEISVSSSNTTFKTVDGILYSKDGSRLIACPAMRGKTSCTLSRDVAVIENGAFSGAKHLKTVYFKGSATEWTRINIGAHNELLDSVHLTCNYSEGK